MEPNKTKVVNLQDASTEKNRTITILEGAAPPYKPDTSININGTLQAPSEFLAGRGELDETKIHLLIERDKGALTLRIQDTNSETSHTVKGTLSEDSDLQEFGVNNDNKKWGPRDLVKFLRKMKFYFADKSEHDSLIASLQQWNISVERIFSDQNNDRTGESKMSLETKVNSVKGLNSFTLEIPIYKGYEKVRFKVDIGIDTLQTSAQLYLYSDQLIETKFIFREKIMNSEIEKFADRTFSKVTIS